MDREQHDRLWAAQVAYALGARAVRRDFNTGTRIRDFDLTFPDRAIEPLELTIFAREPVLQTGRRILSRDTKMSTLTHTWLVTVPNEVGGAPVDVRRLDAEAPALLADLERAGIDSFDTVVWFREPEPRLKETLIGLARLGCEHGRASMPGSGGPQLYVLWGSGGRVDPDLVAEAVEVEANKTDNIEKLGGSDAIRRHLLVYMHSSEALAFAALRDGPVGRIPTLPDPITTAWIPGNGNLLYSVSPPGDWEELVTPDEVFEHPERWAS